MGILLWFLSYIRPLFPVRDGDDDGEKIPSPVLRPIVSLKLAEDGKIGEKIVFSLPCCP